MPGPPTLLLITSFDAVKSEILTSDNLIEVSCPKAHLSIGCQVLLYSRYSWRHFPVTEGMNNSILLQICSYDTVIAHALFSCGQLLALEVIEFRHA